MGKLLLLGTAILSLQLSAGASAAQRAREAGVPFDGEPGPLDAITDVTGVEVGQVTLISGEGALVLGKGPVRTGLTAIFPKGKAYPGLVQAGTFVANGTGEMTGRALIDELGEFSGPVVLTGSGSVGMARDSVQAWYARKTGGDPERTFLYTLPVVAETFDGRLNDTFGQHIKPEHVFEALDGAKGGPVEEGSVGGGTGMIAYGYKAGIGTSSRRITIGKLSYTVGVLVQANYGAREQLLIAGVPVGAELAHAAPLPAKEGSIIVVIATDAPLLPSELRRLALRATHGIARDGGMSGTTSGDLFLAFTTVVPRRLENGTLQEDYVDPLSVNPLLAATVWATEEAVINSLFAGRAMTGIDGHRADALPVSEVLKLLRSAHRLNES
ncbi:MAG TPA: P1 family peptidase [Steroidobacteraceae bacterium]|nr:P1 family peptidase [Steroidobacteraceae bacterium]